MAFYQNFYHPANTVVTIVGDIFGLKALGQIQVNFGDFKKARSIRRYARARRAKTTAANTNRPRRPPRRQTANSLIKLAVNLPPSPPTNLPANRRLRRLNPQSSKSLLRISCVTAIRAPT